MQNDATSYDGPGESGGSGTLRVQDRVPGDYRKGARFVVILPAVEK